MDYITEAFKALKETETKIKTKKILKESKTESTYLKSAKEFAAIIPEMSYSDAEKWWNDYNFSNHLPENDAEQIIYDALKAKLDSKIAESEDDAEEELVEEEEVPEEEPKDAIDVIKDKLDIQTEDGVATIAEKGEVTNPDAPKIEVEVTDTEAATLETEFNNEVAEDPADEEKDEESEESAEEIIEESKNVDEATYDELSYDDKPIEELEFAESLNESVESSLPATTLGETAVEDYINSIPSPAPGMPPRMFKLGYISEVTKPIQAKYRGGRGSEGQPVVRIFKCTEYSALYTGCDWKNTNNTKTADKELGTERHTGEKTGFHYEEGQCPNKIGTYPDGSKALQAYISGRSKQQVKWFLSLNDEDLVEVEKEVIAEYLTPACAAKILNPTHVPAGFKGDTGEAIYDKPINRFKLENIYMIGNLGSSIM